MKKTKKNMKKNMEKNMPRLHHLLVLGALFAAQVQASGFAVQNQNGAGIGNAFAGAAAAAEDGSTIYFNPAGMTYLPEGHSVTIAATMLKDSINFSDRGTQPIFTLPLGSNGGDAGNTSLVPAAYYAYSITSRLRVGLGVSQTFANKTEYSEDFIGRFGGYMADVKQININPSIAYKFTDAVSLGLGLNYARHDVEFRDMVALRAPPHGYWTSAQRRFNGEGSGRGWNVGAMVQVSPATRVGVAYRSKIKVDIDATFAGCPLQYCHTFRFRDRLETPDSYSVAVSQQLDERWEMLGDLTWTGWGNVSSYDFYRFKFKDAWRVGFGANFKLDDAWKLRFGIAHDTSPVPGEADRTMTLPDSSRTWLSIGARYRVSKMSSLDLGYSHVFFKDASVARVADSYSQTIRGDFNTSVDILSAQLNFNF